MQILSSTTWQETHEDPAARKHSQKDQVISKSSSSIFDGSMKGPGRQEAGNMRRDSVHSQEDYADAHSGPKVGVTYPDVALSVSCSNSQAGCFDDQSRVR